MDRTSPWSVVLALALIGCGQRGGSPDPAAVAAAATESTPAAERAPAGASSGPREAAPDWGWAGEDVDPDALIGELVSGLTLELRLDPEQAAAAHAAVARAWADVRIEVVRRAEAGADLREEALDELFAQRQERLDRELATLLTPTQRGAFARLLGEAEEAR